MCYWLAHHVQYFTNYPCKLMEIQYVLKNYNWMLLFWCNQALRQNTSAQLFLTLHQNVQEILWFMDQLTLTEHAACDTWSWCFALGNIRRIRSYLSMPLNSLFRHWTSHALNTVVLLWQGYKHTMLNSNGPKCSSTCALDLLFMTTKSSHLHNIHLPHSAHLPSCSLKSTSYSLR